MLTLLPFRSTGYLELIAVFSARARRAIGMNVWLRPVLCLVRCALRARPHAASGS